MQDLHDALTATGKAALNQSAALSGLGGIGKTQMAVAYAYRYFWDTPSYEWVFWVRADTELSLVTGLATIARSLNLPGESLDEFAGQTKRWLETHSGWLLIFDNADEPEIVQPWLPRQPQGRSLLTSRAQRFTSLGIRAPITVKKLSLTAAIAFLQDRCDRPVLDATEGAALKDLATAIDGLPLALEQAGAYLAQTGVAFAVYWNHYQRQQLTLLERRLPETGNYPASVATTWLLNVEQVQQRSPGSIPILQLSAVLSPDDIAEPLLLGCAAEFGLTDCTDELALAEQLAALTDFSLIQRERATRSYSIHRLVQQVIWQGLTATEQQQWLQRGVAGVGAVFPDVTQLENWAACGQLTPHVQTIALRAQPTDLETLEWAWLASVTGYYLNEQGRYAEAEPFFLRSLSIRQQQFGDDHPDVATSLNNLAALYESQGRYPEAEPFYLRSLSIRQQQFGDDHPDVATSLNNLAGLYESQGRYPEAERLYLQTLAIFMTRLGADHPSTETVIGNFVYLLQQVLQAGRATELSAHPLTQALLRQIQTGNGNA